MEAGRPKPANILVSMAGSENGVRLLALADEIIE
jgi:hypothetical protein